MTTRDFKYFRLAALPAMALSFQCAFAEPSATAAAQAEHGDSTMREYQASGGSPLANVPMHQAIKPLALKMSETECDKA